MIKLKQYIKTAISILILLFVLTFIPLYTTHIALYNNNPDIYIEGLEYLNESDILNVIENEYFFNFNFNIGEIKKKVEEIEFVRNVKVSFLLPNIYIIQVIERTPIFMIASNENEIFYDIYGESLQVNSKSINYFPVPIITHNQDKLINYYSNEKLKKLMKELFIDNKYLYDNISEIIISQDIITLITDKHTKIIIDDLKVSDKLNVLYSFQETISHIKSINDYLYIDLSVENKVIVKEKKHG